MQYNIIVMWKVLYCCYVAFWHILLNNCCAIDYNVKILHYLLGNMLFSYRNGLLPT